MSREMRSCELCYAQASAYCESDRASLCWNCDAKVHGANFLVARHSRTLLCQSCQSHTPWKACGAKLGNTVSFCETCTGGGEEESEDITDGDVGTDNGTDLEEEDDGDDVDQYPANGESYNEDEDDEDDEACGDAQDGDHEVVPLSRTSPLPPSTNSSSSHESAYRFRNDEDFSESFSALPFSIKRMRESASDLHLQENLPSSSETRYDIKWMSKSAVQCEELLRPLKDRRIGRGGTSVKSSYRIV